MRTSTSGIDLRWLQQGEAIGQAAARLGQYMLASIDQIGDLPGGHGFAVG